MRGFNGYFSDDRKRKSSENFKTNNHLDVLRVVRQPIDIRIAMKSALEAGLTLQGFQTNDNLELYYDVFRQQRRLCYLSKGWTDPGFRIGELIEIDRKVPAFKDKFSRIFEITSRNLISVGVFESNQEHISLNLQVGFYNDGFNALVLKEAVDVLDESLGEIRQILIPC